MASNSPILPPTSAPPASVPIAIVTGGASGMGLAATKHLISKGYRVLFADSNKEAGEEVASSLGTNAKFIHCDVAQWADNAAMFKTAWEWSGRLDFFAANAGINDTEPVLGHFDLDQEPSKPDLECMNVNLTAVLYGLKLFIHYTRKTKLVLDVVPKMSITASAAGVYPFPAAPQYCASKHALVGLARAARPRMLEEGLTLNAILPNFVSTGFGGLTKVMVDAWPKERVTPISTILKAYDALLGDDMMSGQTVECSVDKIHIGAPVEYVDESARWCMEDGIPYLIKWMVDGDPKKRDQKEHKTAAGAHETANS